MWGRFVHVAASTGPLGPSTHPPQNETRAAKRSTLYQRNPSSCAPASVGDGRGHEEGVQIRVSMCDVLEQQPKLGRCRRLKLTLHADDSVRPFGRIVPDPPPPDRLRERRPQHDVHPRQGPSGERLAANLTSTPKLYVDSIDVARGEIPDGELSEARMQVAVEHRSRLTDCRRRPTHLCDCEPGFEQLAHRRPRSVESTNSCRVGSDEHAQLPRSWTALAH